MTTRTQRASNGNSDLRLTAEAYAKSGLSVLPIRTDGSKAPTLNRWTQLQRAIADSREISRWFSGRPAGVGIIAGSVSGGLEVIDFDKAGLFEQFAEEVERLQPNLIARLPQVRTPSAGMHLFYRCDKISGNQKLAQEPGIDERAGKAKPETMIETRGEGGYVVAPGSPAACHETGRLYEHVAGTALTTIPKITPPEREILLRVARSFNTWMPETEVDDSSSSCPKRPADENSPGSAFNRDATWQSILEPHSWVKLHTRSKITHWRRPGKSDGWSATTGVKSTAGNELFCVFSSNAYPFEGPVPPKTCSNHSKFAAYAILNHGGDFSAAARELGQRGYGEKWKVNSHPGTENDDGPISNARVERDGEETHSVPLTMREINLAVSQRTGDWPRRVGTALFVHDDLHGVAWLNSTAALFGWLSSKVGSVHWSKALGCVTKEEFFHEQRRTSKAYKTVEVIPHEPPIDGHYYACTMPRPGDGETLRQLLDRFCPATTVDRDLMLGAFMTVIWGGPPGTRPAFVIDSDDGRGSGKSKFAAMTARIVGGALDFSPKDDIDTLKSRLLSPDALTKRVAMLDNIKSLNFSRSALEALITAPAISGKKMYVGEAIRPNTLTWIITLNGASLSTDLAQRCVIIKVEKPKRSGNWEEETARFIDDNRDAIIADLVAWLRAPRHQIDHYTRWATWERDVLSRLPEPADAQKLILERQSEADVEMEEADLIQDFFREQLERLDYDPDREIIHIPNDALVRWFNWATHQDAGPTGATRTLKRMNSEGRLPRLRPNPSRANGRGFLWKGQQVDLTQNVQTDLKRRLAERMKESKRDSWDT